MFSNSVFVTGYKTWNGQGTVQDTASSVLLKFKVSFPLLLCFFLLFNGNSLIQWDLQNVRDCVLLQVTHNFCFAKLPF